MIIAVIAVGLSSCKKEGPMGPKGEQGVQGEAGPGAKNSEMLITFNAGDTQVLFGSFPDFEKNDVIITYMNTGSIAGSFLWTQIPYLEPVSGVNFVPQFSENTGNLWIHVERADGGSGSPVTGTVSIFFRAVHIKASGLIANPDVDLSNYEEVVNTFNIEE